MVDVIRRFHGGMDVILHHDLEVTLLGIQRPSIEAKNNLLINPSSNHFDIATPIL
jgi:hypothetical protein